MPTMRADPVVGLQERHQPEAEGPGRAGDGDGERSGGSGHSERDPICSLLRPGYVSVRRDREEETAAWRSGVPRAGERYRRPAQPARCIVPATGGCDLAHARGGGADLRREATPIRAAARPRRVAPRPGAALPAARRGGSARPGPPALGRRRALRPALPPAQHRAPGAGQRVRAAGRLPPASSRTTCAATGRCGRCGSWKASIAIASRSSPRPTTRLSTVSPASTSSACSSRPTRRSPGRGGPSLRPPPPGW